VALTAKPHVSDVPVVIRRTGRTLAAEALSLRRRLGDHAFLPVAWSEPAFVREVGLVRAHLAPIRSRAGLAASFSREAFQVARADDAHDPPGAVRVAYALRWLELGNGRSRPAWPPDPPTTARHRLIRPARHSATDPRDGLMQHPHQIGDQ
jgi:hypothetical protein